MSSDTGLQELSSLVNIINESYATIQKSTKTFPSINEQVFNPAAEAWRADPEAAKAARTIAAAANQLAASVLSPPEALGLIAGGAANSAASRVALMGNFTEILREFGPLHAKEIGAKSGVDPKVTARVMRILASNHMYREVEPDVFANNRVSSAWDTGKSHKELIEKPDEKHENTIGFTAMSESLLSAMGRPLHYLWEWIADPNAGPESLAFHKAFNTSKSMWEWYEEPGNERELKNMAIGMTCTNGGPEPPILEAYDWESLPKDSVVVDVGGGVGSMSLPLALAQPHLKVVLQDRPETLEQAKAAFKEMLPEALSTGRIELMPHNFFTQNPVKAPSIYHFKSVLHDWSDANCTKFLKAARASADPEKTKLILLELETPYACPVPSKHSESFVEEGRKPDEYPAPLLANGGAVIHGMIYPLDMAVLATLGGQVRTVMHLKELCRGAGWEIKVVKRLTKTPYTSIIAVPI